MNRITTKNIILSLVVAMLLTGLTAAGAIHRLDQWVEDALFQHPSVLSGDVVVIGIDEEALEEYGPFQSWDRNIMASALEALASDEKHLPAVVGVDTLYSGTTDREADRRLSDAAAKLGCVVTADMATFGTGMTRNDNGSVTITDYNIVNFEQPYDSLKSATVQGHINAMTDSDGVMRHAILYLDTHDAGRVYSMARVCAQKFAEKNRQELIFPKTNGRGQFYVSFTAKPGAFYEDISISDLIRGDVPTDYYEDKIVLIGPYAAGLQDAVLTPIERGEQMYGVEYQANVIEEFLRGEYKYEASDLWQYLLLFVLLFAGLLLLYRMRFATATIVTAAVIAADLLAGYIAYRMGVILHPLWIPLWFLVVYIISVGVRFILERAERRRVTQTFERYVAPEIVQDILNQGTDSLALGGRLCDIAVLFVDVRGFTSMSERLEPEQVVSVLNRYLGMTSECITNNRGTLDKFVGDAAMAFWGAPIAQDDGIFLAVKTAMEIVKGARLISAELKAEIGEELNVGVGVHYGPAVVGNIGAERRMDYTAIGDTVNTAARLEANAPAGTVYISRTVADELEGRIRVTSLGDTIKLKGKSDGFEILKVEEIYQSKQT